MINVKNAMEKENKAELDDLKNPKSDLTLTLKHHPELASWKDGKEYDLSLKVKQVKSDKRSASFLILGASDEGVQETTDGSE